MKAEELIGKYVIVCSYRLGWAVCRIDKVINDNRRTWAYSTIKAGGEGTKTLFHPLKEIHKVYDNLSLAILNY